MTKYGAIVADVRQKIADGTYSPGDRMPSTDALCAHYGVSKITIKRAMDDLVQQGVVSRRRGAGTFVKAIANSGNGPLSAWRTSSDMRSFYSNAQIHGFEATSELHGFSVLRPEPSMAAQLGMEEDEFAYYLCRTRLANGVPGSVEYTYMPIKTIPGLRRRHVEGSVYGYIENELGLHIASSNRVVTAVSPTVQEAAWLNITTDAAVLCVTHIGYLDDGRPFEHAKAIFCPDYTFASTSTK